MFLILWLIMVIGPISNLLHELGHALAAKLLKANQIRISIGSGDFVKRISMKGIEISILSWFFIGGFIKSSRTPIFTRLELMAIAISGPILSGIISIVSLLCYFIYMNEFLLLITIYNGWLALINLIPFRIKNKQSDGFVILTLIRNKK